MIFLLFHCSYVKPRGIENILMIFQYVRKAIIAEKIFLELFQCGKTYICKQY